MVLYNTLDSLPNILQKEEHMKKVLSFVLSVAMVICLMPSLAFAADDDAESTTTTTATATGLSQFSDADSISNEKKEAVAVLVGLGIIDGMGDGTFQPQGNLTRAQASKLVATLVKSGDKSDIPAPSADPFTDVAKSYWGAGAIKFGVDNGYINGMGDGTFHPEDQVTTAQLATMLCKLLGYTVEDVNKDWPDNAMSFANDRGLLLEVNKGASEALNREEAARMIYNALCSTMQVKQAVVGSDNPEYRDVRNTTAQDYRSPARDSLQQLIEKYFPTITWMTNAANLEDVFARPVTVWKNGKENITDEIVEKPEFVYTSSEISEITNAGDIIVSDKLASDLDGYVATAPVFVNGVQDGVINTDDSDDLAEAIALLTGNGTLVELYTNEKDTEIDYVVVAEYEVDKVKSVNSRNGKISLTHNNREEITTKAKFYNAISSAGRDDLVLVAVGQDDRGRSEVIDAYLPEAVNGVAITKITRETKRGRGDFTTTIGGTVYTDWAADVQEWSGVDPVAITVNADDTGTAYLDQYGYLAAYAKANNDASDWALLKSVYTASADNEVGETSTNYYGMIVTEDGSVESVPLLYVVDDDDDNFNAAQETVGIVEEFKTNNPPQGDNQHNWYADPETTTEGMLVAYKEAAAGYKLSRDDFREPNVKSDGLNGSVQIDKDTKKIDDVYLSDSLSVVTVSGSKASKLSTKTASSITKTYRPDQYKYVWKKIGDNTLVTAVFIVGTIDNSKVIKIDKIKGRTTYGSADLEGIEIDYYTADSSELQSGIISIESRNYFDGALCVTSEIKEGMTVNGAGADNKAVTATITPNNGDEAYGSSMTIGGVVYQIADGAVVIDRAETDIASVETLVAQIARTGANDNTDTIGISFTWSADGSNKVVKQIYVDSLTSPAAGEIE
jgi:hypothetical protein